MKLNEFFGITILAEITLVLSRFVTGEPIAMRFSDVTTLLAVMFGVSPYGRLCFLWIYEKIEQVVKTADKH
jgi:hypothetical protein